MRIATRCENLDQFIAAFHRFCDEQSFFVSTLSMREIGVETAFSIDLADGTPVLRGQCVVLDAWPSNLNPFKRPGVKLGIRQLTSDAQVNFARLNAARAAAGGASSRPTTETSTPAPIPTAAPVPLPIPAAVARPVQTPPRIPVVRPLASPPIGVPVHVRPVVPAVIARPQIAEPRPTPPAPVPAMVDESIARPATVTLVDDSIATPTTQSDAEFGSEITVVPRADERIETATERRPHSIDASDASDHVLTEIRTPGSDLILPANPLMNLSDEQLEGFVDCTMYEETGSYFRAAGDPDPDDSVIPRPEPPVLAPLRLMTPLPVELPHPSSGQRPVAVSAPFTIPPPFAPTPFVPTPVGAQPVPVPIAPTPPDPVPDVVVVPSRRALALKRLRQQRVMIALAAGGVALAVLVIALVWRGGRPATASSQPPPTKQMAAIPAQPAPAPAPAPAAAAPQDEPMTATDNGAPIVGSGPCRVRVTSTPAGSIISIDDHQVGPSPLTIDGPCDKRKIDIAHPRYASATRSVSLQAGKPQAIDVGLARPTHALTVTTVPLGAAIAIQGRRAGTTPSVVQIMGFTTLTLTISKPGFQTVTKKIYSKRAQDQLFVTLPR